jgi:hypothetical protein
MVDQQQARMMAYDSTITSFNAARLAGVAYPLLRNLMEQTDPVRFCPVIYALSHLDFPAVIHVVSDISIARIHCG